ncbi:GFA family protein [Erythrobacter sp. THAF29]|uniref:GFA family protein n=1 Tax=Erythrobacter sp. THAF29 TaxID=2587851 RepID=UPI001267ED1E|nr:GFA family protein [Erythrobacter sp. THAF29]QFT78793.1 glutathione-dependent formaldehyde-activating enzyme [Erythrobacter sp. THAF29]
MAQTGGCLCGKVRYTLDADPIVCVTCHCKNCQKQAGSALSIIIGVPENALEVEGQVKTYNDKGDSGATVYRQFCDTCGSPVFTRLDDSKGLMFIKAGTLDDTSGLQPQFHCYTKSKQNWFDLGGIPGFDTVPEGM